MELRVVFSVDPTGFDPDITEIVEIPSGVNLFCNHDKNVDRIHDVVKESIMHLGYDVSMYFQLFKVYVVDEPVSSSPHKMAE